ncbi:MAG: hypothetical protein IJS28_10740 [Synergistaceae bacterium]|nr:hypothetical protein [Synergistaceae bacterium]
MTKNKPHFSIWNLDFDTFITSPLVLWIISIAISVTMWVYVTGTEEASYITRKFTAPLEYRGLDAQAILRGRVSEVDVEVRGPEEAMMRLDYNSVIPYVDARNLASGTRYTVNVNVSTPGSISLVSCTPSQITLDLVRQVTRLMTVETVLPQNIPEGHYIEGVEIIPKEVGIKGAEDDVAKVGSVRITPTIEQLQEGGEQLMAVRFSQSEPFDGAVAIEPAQVRFKGNLVRGLPRKRVPVNVRLSGKLDSDYEVRSIITDPSEIQIEGDTQDLAKVEAIDTEIIDVTGLNEDRVIVVPLRQPEAEGVSLTSGASVRVTIQLSEARAERMIANIPVEFRNTDSPKEWLSSPQHVSVTIEGKPSLIESFDPAQTVIKAYIDMSNIFMAPVTLPVRAETVSGDAFRVIRIDPQNVTVNAFSTAGN